MKYLRLFLNYKLKDQKIIFKFAEEINTYTSKLGIEMFVGSNVD